MMVSRSIRYGVVSASLAIALPAFAQAPETPAVPVAQKPANASPVGVKAPDLPSPPPNFEYTVLGRRDPFISLVNRGAESGASADGTPVKRAEGVPGMLTAELRVRGIVQTRGVWVAMVSGPDNKVYTVRAGDKLADGVIRTVNATTVVIFQEVNDPLSLEKQREVRKFLRGGEEVK
jgi:Tfp pilus assembly protein PilP